MINKYHSSLTLYLKLIILLPITAVKTGGHWEINLAMLAPGTSDTSDVIADINYFPATNRVIKVQDWKPRYLGIRDEYTRKMKIRNIRGMEGQFELQKNGFQFVQLPDKPRNVDKDTAIRTEYYREVEEVIRAL